MMEGELRVITPEELITEVMRLKDADYRLIQICATRTEDGYELTYTFGMDLEMVHLRLNIQTETKIVSISHIYEPAFLYENEIHDLFGVEIEMIAMDYHGHLYKIKQQAPFK